MTQQVPSSLSTWADRRVWIWTHPSANTKGPYSSSYRTLLSHMCPSSSSMKPRLTPNSKTKTPTRWHYVIYLIRAKATKFQEVFITDGSRIQNPWQRLSYLLWPWEVIYFCYVMTLGSTHPSHRRRPSYIRDLPSHPAVRACKQSCLAPSCAPKEAHTQLAEVHGHGPGHNSWDLSFHLHTYIIGLHEFIRKKC